MAVASPETMVSFYERQIDDVGYDQAVYDVARSIIGRIFGGRSAILGPLVNDERDERLDCNSMCLGV